VQWGGGHPDPRVNRSSCDDKNSVSFGDPVSQEAGNASHEAACPAWISGGMPLPPCPAACGRRASTLARRSDGPARRSDALARRSDALARRSDALARRSDALARRSDALARRSDALARRSDALARRSDAPARRSDALARCSDALARCSDALARCSNALARCSNALARCSATSAHDGFVVPPGTAVGARPDFRLRALTRRQRCRTSVRRWQSGRGVLLLEVTQPEPRRLCHVSAG